MATELELKERLINDYKRLKRIRKQADLEGATETVRMLDEEIEYIKLTLQPLELPQ